MVFESTYATFSSHLIFLHLTSRAAAAAHFKTVCMHFILREISECEMAYVCFLLCAYACLCTRPLDCRKNSSLEVENDSGRGDGKENGPER